jgi:uncharacterized membrane protein YeiH
VVVAASLSSLTTALPPVNADFVLNVLVAAGVMVAAVAVMSVASTQGMDLVGAFSLACVNAFGGGTVRDLLLDNRPFYWMDNWGYIVVILAICIPFVYSASAFRVTSEVHRRSGKVDALGLALFTVTGVGVALTRESPLVVAVLMGVITGTMGGVLRDLVVNEIPEVFRPGSLYATAALGGAIVFVESMDRLGYEWAIGLGIGTVVVLRLASLHWGVGIPAPQWSLRKDKEDPGTQ